MGTALRLRCPTVTPAAYDKARGAAPFGDCDRGRLPKFMLMLPWLSPSGSDFSLPSLLLPLPRRGAKAERSTPARAAAPARAWALVIGLSGNTTKLRATFREK